eukprot:4990414-Alexandrium_andersonii.AAC.1
MASRSASGLPVRGPSPAPPRPSLSPGAPPVDEGGVRAEGGHVNLRSDGRFQSRSRSPERALPSQA